LKHIENSLYIFNCGLVFVIKLDKDVLTLTSLYVKYIFLYLAYFKISSNSEKFILNYYLFIIREFFITLQFIYLNKIIHLLAQNAICPSNNTYIFVVVNNMKMMNVIVSFTIPSCNEPVKCTFYVFRPTMSLRVICKSIHNA
jgi:hypothetical protein